MENLNLPPFYPGQKVVLLKTSVKHDLKKGTNLTVAYCIKSDCNCGWIVMVKDLPESGSGYYDCECGKHTVVKDYNCGAAQYFAPLEEKFEHISLSKVIEIETCLVSEN